MKNKNILMLLSIISLLNLSSCVGVTNNSSTNSESSLTSSIEEIKTYKITWTNYDGSVLEVDDNLDYGSVPSYDGVLPKKVNDVEKTYVFAGWSPSISLVKEDTIYTAIFNEVLNDEYNHKISSDNKEIEY